jgi:hypothetical protein
MLSSGMLRNVALVGNYVSEEHIASFNKVTRNSIFCSFRQLLVTPNIIPSSPILVTMMMEALSSSETSVLTRETRRNIPEDGIIYSHRRENLKSYIALTGWTLQRRCNVSLVRYELGLYSPEDDIPYSGRHENLISYIALTDWTLYRRCNVSLVRYELRVYIPEDGNLHSHCRENLKSYIALTGWTL